MGWSGENQHSDGIPIPPALDEEWKERDPDDHRCYPEDVGSWDDFPGQVRTYLLRPVPWLLCENRPANKVVDGVVVPDVYTDYYGFGVEFGMEEYKLLTVTSVSRFLRLKQSLPWHSGPPLQAGDVLLEVNGEPLCGGGTGVPYTVMKVLWWKNMTLSITVVSPQHLNNDLDVSHYLNDAMFPKHSLKWAIQRCLRVTIYCLSVPVTNRPRRSDDLDRLDGGYLFVTNEELYRWLGRQYFVEGGEYEGHFYGTIWPFHRRILTSAEDEWKFIPLTTFCPVAPSRGRRMSFKKAIGMIPKDSKEDVSLFDLEPRSGT